MSRSALAGLALVVLTACSTATDASVPIPSDAGNVTTDPGCASFADYLGSEGTVVTFLVPVQMQTVPPLESTWADFTRCTGIRIINAIDRSEDSDEFYVLLDSGNPPDLTAVAQPALIADLVHRESAPGGHPPVPAAPAVAANVTRHWNPAWRQYASVDGVLYGSPLGANLKSLVWYSPKRFRDLGYRPPTTWRQLIDLSERIARSGARPWCGGIEDGSASGWPATDWLEEVVLGSGGSVAYDAWVSHDLPFDSPTIRTAMSVLDGWMHNPDFVNGGFGGVASIARTSFQDVGQSIVDGTCLMYPFPSFYAGWWDSFQPGATLGPDGDVFAFALPAVDPDIPNPLIGGGEFIVAFSARPEVQKAHAYLASAEWASRRVGIGSFVSANNGVPLDAYTDPISRLSADLLTTPGATFRFDASDLMPLQVGEEEWKQLTAWFAEDKPIEDVLRAIDASWPVDETVPSPSP